MCESISPIVEFTSISKEFRHEYIVEKSRFITTICPCSTEEEAQAFINRINKEYWDARLLTMESHLVPQENLC